MRVTQYNMLFRRIGTDLSRLRVLLLHPARTNNEGQCKLPYCAL